MEKLLAGGCQCGRVRYEIAGGGHGTNPREGFDFVGVHICHCSMCRRAVGNVVAIWLAVDAVNVIFKGTPKGYRSSPFLERLFCEHCGTPIGSRYAEGIKNWPYTHLMGISVGTLDDPELVRPDYHFGVEGRISWVDLGRGLPEKRTEDLEGFAEFWVSATEQFPEFAHGDVLHHAEGE